MIRFSAAVSLDGKIADADGGVGWLAAWDPADLGFTQFLVCVDMLVMGRATYDQARSFGDWPYRGKRCFVLTSRPLDDAPPPGVVAAPDLDALLPRLQGHPGMVWVVGGARTLQAFMVRDAVDEIELFILPIILGKGISAFRDDTPRMALSLTETEPFRNGVMRLLYQR